MNTVSLFGMKIHALNMNSAVDLVHQWCREPLAGVCRYVVTPNVDHAVMFQSSPALRKAYDQASLVLADGFPVVWASRILGKPLPERVAGSDLVPAIFEKQASFLAIMNRPLRVFFLGAGPGVALRAAHNIHRRWSQVEVVGTYSPPLGFENDTLEGQRILQRIAETSPDLLLVGFGAPKQELWVERHASLIHAKVALCVGATIDFLAGEKKRSPQWMQDHGLEWLHRLISEPQRLARRYFRDALVFPRLIWQEWRKSPSTGAAN